MFLLFAGLGLAVLGFIDLFAGLLLSGKLKYALLDARPAVAWFVTDDAPFADVKVETSLD